MRVAVWSGMGRLGEFCTGVGKHILNMSCGLSEVRDCSVKIVLSSDLGKREEHRREPSRMDGLVGIGLPFSRRAGEAMWRTLGRPQLDRWIGNSDWLYCPKELYVPVHRAKYAVTVHDLYWIEPAYNSAVGMSRHRWHRVLRKALRHADLVLTVSNFTKERLVELTGTNRNKIRVVGNGIEEDYFVPISEDEKNATTRISRAYILSVGGLTRKKGGDRLLRLAEVLRRVAPGLLLVVIGPVEREYERRVAEAENVRVLRRGIPNIEMKRLLNGARAVVTLSEYEGFGIPVLEAMAVGTPVVAAGRAALPEVVGNAGILVDPDDAANTAAVLVNLIDDSSERESLIEQGYKHAAEYTWSRCIDRLYAALLEFNGGSGAH